MQADTTNKVVHTISQVLDELGRRFGATGAHLWQVMVKQVYVEAMQSSLTSLILLITSICFFLFARKIWKDEDADDDKKIGFGIVTAILGIITFIFTTIAISDVSQALINPEYVAFGIIKDLFH